MLKKFCSAMLGAAMVFGMVNGELSQKLYVNASAAQASLIIVNSLPVSVLNETFDFDDADSGKEIAGWNNWIKQDGGSQYTLDSKFSLGKDSDENKVAVLERTAASSSNSRSYQVKKSVNIGYGTEKIGIGFRIKSMDADNGSFLLLLETGQSYISINVDLLNSRIITPQITTPFIPLSGNTRYEVAALDTWYTVEIIIDTNIKQIDFYTGGVYRGSSDISNLNTSYGGDVLNGMLKAVSIGTVRTTGVKSGGDSAKMYVDDVIVKAEGMPISNVKELPVTVLDETFDFDDADSGKEIAGWNNWIKEDGGSQYTLDSKFSLGKDSDENKVAVLERTAASSSNSRSYQVKKSVNIGYGTEKIGIGFRIKSMDADNGSFQLILGTDSGNIVIHIDLPNSRIITPQITTPSISLWGNESYVASSLDTWYTVEIIIDTNIKQIDFYTGGVYRGSSDIANLNTSYGGDVLNGKLRTVSIGTVRTTGVKSGGDSAKMYVDDVIVKTDGTPQVKITQTEISDGKLSSITVKRNESAGENEKLIAAVYEYEEGGSKLTETRIIGFSSGKNTLPDAVTIPQNGEIQIFAFDMNTLTPMAAVTSHSKNQTYYISTGGDDTNNGTKMRPWKTLYKAVKEAQAGDTIILADGKYYENYISRFKSGGSKDSPIIVRAENKGKAEIIYPAYTSKKTKLTIPDGINYVTIDGLCFSQETPATDENATNDIYLRCEGDYCNITDNRFSGALEEGIKLNRSVGTVVANNYIEEMTHEGIDIFNSDSVKVHNNEIHNFSRIGILAKGNTRNSQIYNNYVHNSTATMSNCAYCIGGISNNTSPYDIKEGTGYECYSTDFYNNIALAHGSGKIDAAFKWYGTIDCRMYNNVAIGATTGIYFASYTALWDWSPKNVNPIVRNNIIYDCVKAFREDTDSVHTYNGEETSADFGYNLFYNCESTPVQAEGIITEAPQFVNAFEDLHLKADSPAIGKGTALESTVPKYVFNEENRTITKSQSETITIEYADKDGKKRTLPYDMGVYESN